jgi:outer membrane receptor protein involved in Fe transport
MCIRIVVVLAALLASAPSPVRAQLDGESSPAATLTGVIRDESGLALPGASVALVNEQGHRVAATSSGPDGSWTLTGAWRGRGRVSASLPGFRTEARDLEIQGPAPPLLIIVLRLAGYSDEVTVTASRDERDLASVAGSVGVISGPLLAQAPGVNLVETLKFVPGVVAGDVSAVDDLRISIRGAGVRAGFGSRGVVVMVDGVPITEPDGQTPHMDGQIDLGSAERIEVVKGPASALYGLKKPLKRKTMD